MKQCSKGPRKNQYVYYSRFHSSRRHNMVTRFALKKRWVGNHRSSVDMPSQKYSNTMFCWCIFLGIIRPFNIYRKAGGLIFSCDVIVLAYSIRNIMARGRIAISTWYTRFLQTNKRISNIVWWYIFRKIAFKRYLHTLVITDINKIHHASVQRV